MRATILSAIMGIFLLTSTGCSSHDDDYMPYGLKGMNAYVYDEDDREHFAGFSEGNYRKRVDVLSSCQNSARSFAISRHWENWGYVCCTVTANSSCATKVK